MYLPIEELSLSLSDIVMLLKYFMFKIVNNCNSTDTIMLWNSCMIGLDIINSIRDLILYVTCFFSLWLDYKKTIPYIYISQLWMILWLMYVSDLVLVLNDVYIPCYIYNTTSGDHKLTTTLNFFVVFIAVIKILYCTF